MDKPEKGDYGDHTARYFYQASKVPSFCVNEPGWYYWSGYDAYIGPYQDKKSCQEAFKNRNKFYPNE